MRETVYSSFTPRDAAEAIWFALEWVSKNIEYGEPSSKHTVEFCEDFGILARCYPAQNPLSTLRNRRGVCIDYALLTASALLSVNISPIYIIIFKHPNHAVAAIAIDDTIFVLEQRPPPIELGDYFTYSIQTTSSTYTTAFKLWVKNEYVVYEASLLPTILLIDKYPEDSLPPTIAYEVMNAISMLTNLKPSTTALYNPQLTINYTVTIQKIGGDGNEYPIWVLYAPTFHKQWVEYIAQQVLDVVRDIIEEGNYNHIWVEVKGSHITVYLT